MYRTVCFLMAAGTLSFAASVRADNPARPAVAPQAVISSSQNHAKTLADAPTATEETAYIQELRQCRHSLNTVKTTLDKEKEDQDGHRMEAIKAIDKAITAIDNEIVEYKKATGQPVTPAK